MNQTAAAAASCVARASNYSIGNSVAATAAAAAVTKQWKAEISLLAGKTLCVVFFLHHQNLCAKFVFAFSIFFLIKQN